MCGFTVIIKKSKSKKIDESLKKKILLSQKHRGPDNSEILEKKNMIFFHNRLSIIDLSQKASQPMTCKKTGNIIVFNGEIYNFKEIKRNYLGNEKFETNSDTEVILKLYNRFKENIHKYLNGIFSFVIYDYKRNKLFLIRDRFGVKPLIYYEDKELFICSTEIRSINLVRDKVDLDFSIIREYLNYGLIHHSDKTFYSKIKTFKPSTFKIYDLDKKKIIHNEKYWELKKNKSFIQKNYEDFKAIHDIYFQNSLKRNLTSDVPVALLLSSGADSTYLYKNLNKLGYENMNSFSYGWENKKYDESLPTKKELNLNSKSHKILKIDFKDFFSDLSKAIEHNEGPIGGFGTLGVFKLMKLVKKNGYKVTLSGEGSDELNLGYFNQNLSFLIDNLKNNKEEFNRFCKINKIKNNIKFLKKTFLSDGIYAPDGTQLGESVNNEATLNTDQLTKNYLFKIKLPKLLHWQDRCSAAFGIETRVPFLDHDLATFIYSNPNKFKIRNLVSKSHIRDNKNMNVPKKFVPTPQREILKKMSTNILEILCDGYLVKQNLINFEKFKKNYLKYKRSNELGNSFFIWKLLNLELFIGNN